MMYYDLLSSFIYRDVFFRQGPPVAPQATGGPLKKRWPPRKTVASSNIDVQLWCNEIEGVLVKCDMK